MKKIELTQGKYALVDDEDFEYLNQFNWHFGGDGYAVRWVNNHRTLMHRVINNTPETLETDHINGDKIDNQRENLRSVTHGQNKMNQGIQSNNSSGYRGVWWYTRVRKWVSAIKIDKKCISLGYFDNKIDAALAYQEAARKYHGEFRRAV